MQPVRFHIRHVQDQRTDTMPAGERLPVEGLIRYVTEFLAPLDCDIVQHRQQQPDLHLQTGLRHNIDAHHQARPAVVLRPAAA